MRLNGLSTVIVERKGWGSGNTHRSNRLVHGNLERFSERNILQTREDLLERKILLRIAPDLIKPSWFYLPIFADDKRVPWSTEIQLMAYDILAGKTKLPWYKRISEDEWRDLDGLNQFKLEAVYKFSDAHTIRWRRFNGRWCASRHYIIITVFECTFKHHSRCF